MMSSFNMSLKGRLLLRTIVFLLQQVKAKEQQGSGNHEIQCRSTRLGLAGGLLCRTTERFYKSASRHAATDTRSACWAV